MGTYWLAVVIDTLPDSFEDGVTVHEGFDEEVPDDLTKFQFAILARAAASSKVEAEQLVLAASRPYAPSVVKLIADRPEQVIRDERHQMQKLSLGDASLKNSFVGFKKDCAEAREAAIGIIELAIRKSWWQFWR